MDEALTGEQAGEIIKTARRQRAEKAKKESDDAGLDRRDVEEVDVQRQR